MEMRTDRPAHAMHQGDRGVAEGQTGQGGAQHHRLARGQVIRPVVHRAQVRADQPHRPLGIHVRHRVGAAADIGFQRVCKAVDARVGSGARRHRQGQFVIHDRGQRQGALACDQHLFVTGGVGHDGEAGGLAAGSGGGRNADEGHRRAVGRMRCLLAPDVTAGGSQDGDGLGGVHRAAAAKADQAVVMAGRECGDASLDHGVGRVGHGVGKNGGDDAGGAQGPQAFLDGAGTHHPGVGHHQRAGQAVAGQNLGHPGHGAAAHQDAARGEYRVGHARLSAAASAKRASLLVAVSLRAPA